MRSNKIESLKKKMHKVIITLFGIRLKVSIAIYAPTECPTYTKKDHVNFQKLSAIRNRFSPYLKLLSHNESESLGCLQLKS